MAIGEAYAQIRRRGARGRTSAYRVDGFCPSSDRESTAAASPIAQPPAIKPGTSAPTPAHSLDQADLTAFFDGILPLQLERSDIAGASVLVMKDGNVLLQKGYGYADVKSKKPVDPASTIFRLASISKLFTWVSVMQLEEQGKLDLDTDVNQYLDFPDPPGLQQAGHAAQPDDAHRRDSRRRINDIIITDPKQAVSLRDYPDRQPADAHLSAGRDSGLLQLRRGPGELHRPARQRRALRTVRAGAHLRAARHDALVVLSAAAEVARKSAVRGLSRRTPPSPPSALRSSTPSAPAASPRAPADMGRFGQALLNGGELDGKRILKPETLALMWTPQFRASDQLPPICMGFYQDWRNHLRWIGHEGDLIAFHSLFFVEPTQKIVLFVSYNSAGGGGEPRPEIINFFSDRYFPGAPDVQYLKTPAKDLKDIEGTYEATRRDDTTKFKLSTLFGQRSASVDKDGVLTIDGVRDLRGHPIKWKPIGKDLWQAEDDQQRIFAIRDGNNKVVRLAVDFPGVQLQRVPWYENQTWVLIALWSSMGILVLVDSGKSHSDLATALSAQASPA